MSILNKKRSKKKTIPTKYMLLIMTGLCVIIFLLSLTLNIQGGPLKTIAGYVFVPMQSGLNRVGTWISEQTNQFQTLQEVQKKNKELQKQVDKLTTDLSNMKLNQYDLENLQQLYAMDEKYPDYKKLAASVVAKDSGNWFNTFTVNKGTKDGVKVGMNVLAGKGLVGIVTDTGTNYSTIRSIIDDTSNVSAMLESTGDNFNVSGNLESMNKNQVINYSELKDSKNQAKKADPVVTSYISDQYLPGFLIGYLDTIGSNSNNLTKSGTITPVVDFEHLREVLIVMELKKTDDQKEASPTENTETEKETTNKKIKKEDSADTGKKKEE